MTTPPSGSFAASLNEGRAPIAASVAVRFAADGLEIHKPGDAYARLWPYSQLRSNVPVARDATDVVLSLAPNTTESLFVSDPAFVTQLLAHAPALSVARRRWRALQPGLAVLAAVLAIVLTARALELHPAQAVARLMPPETRRALGQRALASLTGLRRVCETPASRLALDRLTRRLLAETPDSVLTARVDVLDWSLVTAVALPGGRIVLTHGLLQQARSPDEVAGVLAHALGHAMALHPETSVVRAIGPAATVQLLLTGAMDSAAGLGLALAELRHTRRAEREADLYALRLLKQTAVSAQGLADFYERLDAARPKSGQQTRPPELLRTHPPAADRIARIRSGPPYDATPALLDEDWQALRQACGGLWPVQQPPAEGPAAEQDIAQASKALQADPSDIGALQKRARAYTRTGRHDLALADYTAAAALRPGDHTLHYGRGSALQSLSRYEEALAAYDAALRIAPTHGPARNNRGNVRRTLKRHAEALQDFDELIRIHPDFLHAHYNRGLVLRDLERLDDAIADFTTTLEKDREYAAAYASRALVYERMGERAKAIADFRAALAAPAKHSNGAWAHRTARERLDALGAPPQ